MHTPEKATYPTLTLIEVLLSFLKIKHGENEDLYDYLSRFKTEREIVMRLAGNNLIDGYIMGLPEYLGATTDADRKQVKSTELQKFMSVLFLRNADQERFGELLVDYRKAYAAKEVKYPADMRTMMDVMRQQPVKRKRKENSQIKKSPEKEKPDTSYCTLLF